MWCGFLIPFPFPFFFILSRNETWNEKLDKSLFFTIFRFVGVVCDRSVMFRVCQTERLVVKDLEPYSNNQLRNHTRVIEVQSFIHGIGTYHFHEIERIVKKRARKTSRKICTFSDYMLCSTCCSTLGLLDTTQTYVLSIVQRTVPRQHRLADEE